MKQKEKKRKIKWKSCLFLILLIFNTFGTFYLISRLLLLSGIETIVRMLVILILALLWILLSISSLKSFKKNSGKFIFLFLFVVFYSIGLTTVGNFINTTYSKIERVSNDETIYSTSLVTLKENKDDNIKTIKGTIGYLSDESSIEGNQLPKEIVTKEKLDNELKEYDNYIVLIKALLNKEIDYIFVPSTYQYMFQNTEEKDLTTLKDTTKIIYSKEKKVKKESKTKKNLSSPFTILLMGVDSEAEDIKQGVFNGDSLMLLTFNPSTLSTTILSIPRDSYVPIACFENQRRNKITHAAWYGESCMIDTIQNFTDVKIDYYVKINFKGLVKIVDALGGVDVDVPYAFCEQNSNREFGANTIYVEAGRQTLNGEQALAFSRNRHPNPQYCSKHWTNYESNDFIRGQHQQEVLKAILNKMKSVRDLNTVNNLLNTVSNNIETNMSTSEILSLYNVGKDIIAKSSTSDVADLISIQKLYLSGVDAYIYDPYVGQTLYDFVIYEESIAAVSEAMKINLGLQKLEPIKDFAFSINEEYEETVIGKGNYSKLPDYNVLPDFTGDSEVQARATAKKLGIKVSFQYVTSKSISGVVLSQNQKVGTPISKVNNLVLTISKKEIEKTDTTKNDKKQDTTKEEVTNNNTSKEETTNSKNNTSKEETESKTEEKTTDKKEDIEIDDNLDDLLPNDEN